MTTTKLLLAGDIGGTKTTLALYRAESRPASPVREQTFQNRQASGLAQLITTFLGQEKELPAVGCFGVAGPVRDGRVKMTNLDWRIDELEIARTCGLERAILINDLVATAVGAVLLPRDELFPINQGKPRDEGTISVLAPGTGLGEAFVLQQDSRSIPVASEGGHASFAPRNKDQLELLAFLLQKEQHVSVEKVCSGLGIPNIYAFLTTRIQPPEGLQQKVAVATDPTPILVQTALKALEDGDLHHICVKTLHLFVDILAAETANLTLKVMATGGVFLGGGLPPRILPFFEPERFMTVFARGVYQKMLAEIPVHILLNPKTALIGAAASGMNR
ncbi:MAG: glucokinase [Desulfobulbaceae bacterium]|nr:glucokinase [Desulfobulbaceae bacterium]